MYIQVKLIPTSSNAEIVIWFKETHHHGTQLVRALRVRKQNLIYFFAEKVSPKIRLVDRKRINPENSRSGH